MFLYQVETHESLNTTDPNGQAKAVVQRTQGTQGVVNVMWRLNAEAASDFLQPLEGTIQFMQVNVIFLTFLKNCFQDFILNFMV